MQRMVPEASAGLSRLDASMAPPEVAPAHIVREDGLPHRSAQSRRRQRTADDVPEGNVERALDLPETRERVPRIPFVGEPYAVDREAVPPVRQKLVVEAPSPRVTLLAAETRLVKLRIAALVQQLQRRVFVQPQLLLARGHASPQPGAKLFHQRLQLSHDPPHIGARLRMLRPVAPHRFALHEFAAQYRPLQF